MIAKNVIKNAGDHNFTRREFLSTSCLALSGTVLALSTQKLPGQENTATNAMPNIDPNDFERKITPRTKAVIAVHLLGTPCDMDPIMKTARKHGVAVLEDCAQCVGGSYHGKKLGSIGDVGIYSFQVNNSN